MNEEQLRQLQWDQLFMRFATDVANMSRAVRLKVGAVAVRDKRVIAIGYNGTPKGEDNSCEELVNGVLVTKSNVIHAEANLITFARENKIDLNGCILYITHSPCSACGYMIAEAGFKEIVFGKHYRITSVLPVLGTLGIQMREWN